MLNAAKHWVLSHKAWSVRFLLLALPWQARWFAEAPTLNGYTWEFGRVSVYVSWFLVLVAAALSFYLRSKDEAWGKAWKRSLPPLLLASLLPILFTTSPHATLSWWLTTLFAVLLFLAIRFSGMTSSKIIFWFSLGLVPHLALGFWQVFAQSSPAFSWLGLAAHDPAALGTSVVEWSGGRFLRAYGGFPHPNIFGGWLAMSLVLASSIADRVSRNMRVWFLVYGALAGAMLVMTFSRSAWIAVLLGCVLAFVLRWKQGQPIQKSWPIFAAMFVGVVMTCALVWPVLTTRFVAEARLETKSLDVRAEALRNGVELVRRHPLVGVGFGAPTVALMEEGLWPADPKAGPPEPPHNVPLMILVEMGFLPIALLLVALWFSRGRWFRPAVIWSMSPVLAVVLPLLFFDHYAWTLWPGKALLAVTLAILFLPAPTLDETPKMATMG